MHEFDRLISEEPEKKTKPRQAKSLTPNAKPGLADDEEVSLLVLYGTTRRALQAIAEHLHISEQEVVSVALDKLMHEVIRDAG